MSDKEKYWHRSSEAALIRYHNGRESYYDDVDYRLRVMLRNAKQRAKNKGLRFDIDLTYLQDLWTGNDGHCALTGREFVLEKEERGSVKLNAPSLDRIIPELGYTKGNVRLVTFQTNICLHNFGEQALLAFARNLINFNDGVE